MHTRDVLASLVYANGNMLHEWQPILKCLAIVGLVPFANNCQRQLQQWQRIYTFILLAANWILTAYGIFEQPMYDEVLVSNFVSVMVFLSQSLAFTVCLLEGMCTFRLHFAFMQQSQRIVWVIQQRLHTGLCRWSLRRRQRFKYIWYSCIAYGSLSISMVVISIKFYYGYFWYALGCILVLRTRCLMAIIYLDYIDFYMSHLNMKLRSVVNSRLRKQRLCLDVNYKMLESFDYLLQLKLVYGEINKLTAMFDDLFGWSLCALLTVIFLDITVNSYWTFLTLSRVFEFYFLYLTLSTVFPLATIISVLCYAAENCKQQGITTGILIQRLLNSKCKYRNKKTYNDLLFEFAMQIKQDPMVIVIKEFVIVDLRLLMKIFTAMVTYLVILLQFRWTYPEDYGDVN
ncbi:putative gustatory receptor 39b [Zeugodacus cucurbitae]|uniref:putative gustatory receptor 39b n=1 Tax=Zeugodacus cucurbitae TaxID=28588 RepID=UPI0023D8F2AD|nr:putative gustatory receptor 39b [Zeugodacus cucurbitae]